MKAVLSHAEFQIAERIALGESKKEVAWKTHRSVYTVETTVKNIYTKLGFSKLSDLVLWYCGTAFDITAQISERKKQVFSFLLLLIVSTTFFDTDNRFCRYRSGRKSKEEMISEIPESVQEN
jgi:DNA-binding CsgD family transcriptional regulator